MNRLDTTFSFPALTEDRWSPWYDVGSLYSAGFAIHTLAAGSPVGAWGFEGSNDGQVVEREKLQGTAPASTAAKKFPIVASTVHGDALAVTGGVAFNSFVIFVDLPRYVRVWFDYTSGGSAASLATVLTCGRE
jgi:hypothetical protein